MKTRAQWKALHRWAWGFQINNFQFGRLAVSIMSVTIGINSHVPFTYKDEDTYRIDLLPQIHFDHHPTGYSVMVEWFGAHVYLKITP